MKWGSGFILTLSVVVVSILISASVRADTIRVGGYPFPPFVERVNGQYVGITVDLIDAMNEFQSKHRFELVPGSSRRRFEQFNNDAFDLIMFEDKAWGWKDGIIISTLVYLAGGEVYIAKADGKKDQRYFDDLTGKSIAIIRGYHYGFADFNSDPQYLKKNFDVQISGSYDGNVLKVHRGRVDLAVVTFAYLKKMFKERPELKSSLLVSKKFDQRYRHTMLLREKGSALSIDELNQLIVDMNNSGVLGKIWQKYDLQELQTLP